MVTMVGKAANWYRDRVEGAAQWSRKHLEESLLPAKGCLIKRVASYVCQFFQFVVMLPLAIATSMLSFTVTLLVGKKADTPLTAFAKHPTWGPPGRAAPVDVGFASAAFQENPLAHPFTNWGKHYINTTPTGQFDQFPDGWNHPERVIERLHALGVNKYRCSLSRDHLQLVKGGPLDPQAVQQLREKIRLFHQNGIELMVTLDHFAQPLWFDWSNPADVAGFVEFSTQMCGILRQAGVRKIVTINEPTVVAFQGWIMGKFPPYKKLDFEGSARVLENMMRAHTQIYHRVKALHPDLEIGFSHDPIRFRPYHKMNPLFSPIERLICHYLSEVNGGALMPLLKTGQFNLKIPFFANYSFALDKPVPADFIGLQYYTDPLLKIGPCGGGSVTRVPGEKTSSYEFRRYPQGLASALEMLGELKTPSGEPMPIEVTEFGIDRGVNQVENGDAERIVHFDRGNQAIQKAIEHGVNVRSLYYWTLIDNAEWYKKYGVRFGVYEFNERTGGIAELPAARWIRDQVAARNQALHPAATA